MTTPNERLVRMRKSFAKDRSVLTEDYKYFTTPDKAAKQLAKQPAQKHTKCRALVRPVLGRRVENNQQKEQIMARNTTYKNSSEAREVKSPAFIAWHVAEKSKDKSFWTRIGAAWGRQGLTRTGSGRSNRGERRVSAFLSFGRNAMNNTNRLRT